MKKYEKSLKITMIILAVAISAYFLYGLNKQLFVNDIVEKKSSNYLLAEMVKVIDVKIPKTLEENTILTMSQIYNKMLNSVDYFDFASGEFITILDGVENRVAFETNLDLAEGYEMQSDNVNTKLIEIKDGQRYIDVNGVQSVDTFVFKKDNSRSLEKAYLAIDENGMNNYVMRADNTNMELARMVLSPQEMTFSFLSDFTKWDIVGVEEVLDRQCCVIEGNNDKYMSQKLGIVSFKIWTDYETGILLKYEGYDESGMIIDYIYVEKIQIGS